MHSVLKFVNFASFICIFGRTHNNNRENRETGKSRNIVFMGLCICILFKLVASVINARTRTAISLKSIAQRRLGSSQQRMMGRTIEELGTAGSVTAGRISVIHIFSPSLAIIMLKFRML